MVKIQNLSQLKKALQVGAEYTMVAHKNRPDCVGLIRVVNAVQSNCVYCKIKNQPVHPYSNMNGGLGIRMDFEKSSHYEFGNTVKFYLSSDKSSPFYEFVVLKTA